MPPEVAWDEEEISALPPGTEDLEAIAEAAGAPPLSRPVARPSLDNMPPEPEEEEWEGKVVRVIDGDTVEVMHDGIREQVHLGGVICPDGSTAPGSRAKQFTMRHALRENVTVHIGGTNEQGETIGNITLGDGRILNEELIASGYASWDRDSALEDTDWGILEDHARRRGVGMWFDYGITSPEETAGTQSAYSSEIHIELPERTRADQRRRDRRERRRATIQPGPNTGQGSDNFTVPERGN